QLSWLNDIKTDLGTFQLGAETLEQKVSGDVAYAVDQRRVNSLQAGYLAHFGDVSLQINARSDDNSQLGRHNTGSAGLAWQLNDDWQLGGTAGTAFKAPTFNDLYWPEDPYSSGNANLSPEESNNKELYIRYSAGTINASLTAYNNKVTNLIQWAESRPYFSQPMNVGEAQLRGITLTTDWQQGDYLAGFSYDYLDASDESTGADHGKRLARRAKHSGLIYAGMALDAWTLRTEIQAQGHRFDDPANQKELAGYALTNLSASWKINKDWSLQARVNNLFDQEYEQVKDYGTLGRNAMLNLRWQQ
ncbi:MAG: TonB-dependent receptor, partial [Burkholderiales bacterium]|nr:TonB-dependent receptor [Burkholderiales bacterium]